jgi:hypothetical protein
MIEHRARIATASRFEPESFRSIDLAPGVRAIIGRPRGKTTTDTQAIAFDSRRFTLPQVRSWLRQHGYRWTRIDVADEAETSNPPAPVPNTCSNTVTNPDAGTVLDQLSIASDAIRRATAAARNLADDRLVLAAIARMNDAQNNVMLASIMLNTWQHGEAIPNDLAGTIVAAGIGTQALTAAANAPGPRRRNPPPPRQLVQIGTLRGLEFTDGSRMEWSVRERWPLLADPGAEKGSRGRLRLFAVPPAPRRRSDQQPHRTSERTFTTWHDFEPRRTYTLDVPLADEFRVPLGRVRAIIYRSDKWQPGRHVDYIHRFTPGAEPEASAKGERTGPEAIQIAGGAWRLTARGLVG